MSGELLKLALAPLPYWVVGGRRAPTFWNMPLKGVLARVCWSCPHLQDSGRGRGYKELFEKMAANIGNLRWDCEKI